jgi:hypothetical protein
MTRKTEVSKRLLVYETALMNLKAEFDYFIDIYEILCFRADSVPVELMLRNWRKNSKNIDEILNIDNLEKNYNTIKEWQDKEKESESE